MWYLSFLSVVGGEGELGGRVLMELLVFGFLAHLPFFSSVFYICRQVLFIARIYNVMTKARIIFYF